MTNVRDAARWLRETLPPDGEWLPGRLLQRYAARDGHAWRTVLRARVRAGASYRRVGFGPDQRSEWHLAAPATFRYRNDPQRSVDPPSTPAVDVVAMCSKCGRSAVLPARTLPVGCLAPGCEGVYEPTAKVRETREPASDKAVGIETIETTVTKTAERKPVDLARVWPGTAAACPVCGRGQLVAQSGQCIYSACSGVIRVAGHMSEGGYEL